MKRVHGGSKSLSFFFFFTPGALAWFSGFPLSLGVRVFGEAGLGRLATIDLEHCGGGFGDARGLGEVGRWLYVASEPLWLVWLLG